MIGISSYTDTMTKLIIRITEARQNISRAELSKSTNHNSYSVLGSMTLGHKEQNDDKEENNQQDENSLSGIWPRR